MLAMVNVAGMGRRARPALAQESPAGETPAEPGPEPSGDSADWGRERAPVATRLEKRTSKMILSGKGRSRLSHCAVSIYGARKKCEVADCLRASGGRLARVRHAISFTDGLERARESPHP
jgi:hypothetical protein